MTRAVSVIGKSRHPLFAAVRKPLRGCVGKAEYSTRKRALEVIQGLRAVGATVLPQEVYHCAICSTWHLSARGKQVGQK